MGRRTNITANGSQHKVKPPTTTAIMVVILTKSNCSHLNVHLSRIKDNKYRNFNVLKRIMPEIIAKVCFFDNGLLVLELLSQLKSSALICTQKLDRDLLSLDGFLLLKFLPGTGLLPGLGASPHLELSNVLHVETLPVVEATGGWLRSERASRSGPLKAGS